MMEAWYLHTVCLDDNPNYCPTTLSDPVFEKTLSDMTAAFTEVADNLGEVTACFCSPCRKVTLVAVLTPIDGSDAAFGPNPDPAREGGGAGKVQELELKIDDKIVFKNVPSNQWSSVGTLLVGYYYEGGVPFKLGFRDQYNYISDEVGSVQVNPHDWYDPVKCKTYDKDIYTNEGHEAGTKKWAFRLKVEHSEKCVDADGNNIFN
jgi:hypothetical protein